MSSKAGYSGDGGGTPWSDAVRRARFGADEDAAALPHAPEMGHGRPCCVGCVGCCCCFGQGSSPAAPAGHRAQIVAKPPPPRHAQYRSAFDSGEHESVLASAVTCVSDSTLSAVMPKGRLITAVSEKLATVPFVWIRPTELLPKLVNQTRPE